MEGITMQNLNNTFEAAINHGWNYIGMAIRRYGYPKEEIRIIQKGNFHKEWTHIQKSYDENLQHKEVSGMTITGISFGHNFQDIEYDLIG